MVSRGELVEIGGSFRIPDVMAKSGAILREVGTTNRTRIADYERGNQRENEAPAARASFQLPDRRLYRTALAGRTGLARAKQDIPLMEDLGSGELFDLRQWRKGEPRVAR